MSHHGNEYIAYHSKIAKVCAWNVLPKLTSQNSQNIEPAIIKSFTVSDMTIRCQLNHTDAKSAIGHPENC